MLLLAAAAPADKISPQDAQSVLDVLNDPARRAAFETTLQAMVRAAHVAAPATPVPLAPNSVGAQIIAVSASWSTNLSGQARALGRLFGNLPAVWNFTVKIFSDPASRADVLSAAWHLALVVFLAGLVEWVFLRVLRRPIAALASHAPASGPDSAPPPSQAAAEAASTAVDAHEDAAIAAQAEAAADTSPATEPEEAVSRERRLLRVLRALRRLPLMLARLLLELLPVGTFLGLTWLGLNFIQPDTQYVLWIAITAYVCARIAVVIARALLSPDYASLRVLHTSDTGAAYAVRWVRRLAALAAFGYAATLIGAEYGLAADAREAFEKAVALVGHIMLIIIVLQCRRSVAAAIRRGVGDRGWGAVIVSRLASRWHLVAIFLIAGQWLVWAARVPNGYQRMWRIFLVTSAIILVLRVFGIVLLGGLERLFRVTPETARRYPGLEDRSRIYLPVLRRTVRAVLWIAGALALLQAWGLNSLAWFRGNALGGKLAGAGTSILVAGLFALVVWEIVNSQLERHLARLARDAQTTKAARVRTLMPILRTVLLFSLLAVFALNALAVIGVNVGPLLAGAGILGVAIGFGSQKLVQDFITGIFLLLENAMQVGDWVTVAGLSGAVENLSIRTMRLRAADGSVHIIPFSSVSTVTNVNRGIGNVPVSVTVPPDTDTDHVSDVLAAIADEMRGERRYADMMLSDFQLWGVDKLEPGAVTVAGQIVCTDVGRWPVQREFNRRLSRRLRAEGIHLASAAQTVLSISAQRPPPSGAAPAGLPAPEPPP